MVVVVVIVILAKDRYPPFHPPLHTTLLFQFCNFIPIFPFIFFNQFIYPNKFSHFFFSKKKSTLFLNKKKPNFKSNLICYHHPSILSSLLSILLLFISLFFF